MEPLFSNDLCLRPLAPGDAEAFVTAVRESVATVGRWLPWCHGEYSRIEAMQWFSTCAQNIADGSTFDLGIFSADGKELLGGVGLNEFDELHNFCNLGYWIRESRQRQGIATRAAQMMSNFGFSKLGLTRIEIVVAQGNGASNAVARKMGAVYDVAFENTPAFRWLEKHANSFGFYLSFPEGNLSGYRYEPWHWCFKDDGLVNGEIYA